MLTILEAVTLAETFLGREHPYSSIKLEPGYVKAMGIHSGCILPTEGLDVEIAVPGEPLVKALKALRGTDVEITRKGRQVFVTGPSVEYTIRGIPATREVPFPELPDGDWVPLSEQVTATLAAMGRTASHEGNLAGVRIGPKCAIAASYAHAVILWADLLPLHTISVWPDFFRQLEGAAEILFVPEGTRLWIRDARGALRWTRTLAIDYPDESIMKMATQARNLPQRESAKVNLAKLAKLAKQATAIAPGKVAGYWLEMEGDELRLHGGRSGFTWGAANYRGSMPLNTSVLTRVQVGIVASVLEQLAGMVAKLAKSEPDKQWIAAANQQYRAPVAVWGGDEYTVEGLLAPVHVEAPSTTER